MTEYEIESLRQANLQSVMALADVQATHVSIYLTIVFAYIVVAYIAGAKMTRFQLGLATFLFVAACLWELMMITSLGTGASTIGREIIEGAEVPQVLSESGRQWFSWLLWSSGMIAALIFMWDVRRAGPGQ